MKQLKQIFFGLMLWLAASLSHAATFDLGLVQNNAPFDGKVGDGPFSEVYDFATNANIRTVTVSITNVSVAGIGKVEGFEAELDGNKATLQSLNNGPLSAQFLVATGGRAASHTLTITGTAPDGGASFGGAVAVAGTSNVPVPAAVWLFGSALAGLFGANKRRVAA